MSTWYYINENGEKIAVTGRELKQLAQQGSITLETAIETEDGKIVSAGKVKGLMFGELLNKTNPFATSSREENPFTAPVPVPVSENPLFLASGAFVGSMVSAWIVSYLLGSIISTILLGVGVGAGGAFVTWTESYKPPERRRVPVLSSGSRLMFIHRHSL
jgi:hypothetical protein